jgi:transposase-like protein
MPAFKTDHGFAPTISIIGALYQFLAFVCDRTNNAALEQINEQFLLNNLCFLFIIIRQIKYLNNIVEQDHRHIKRIIKPMLGFKSFVSAKGNNRRN